MQLWIDTGYLKSRSNELLLQSNQIDLHNLYKKLFLYRGSLPNAIFGSWKNLHQPKFALAKYLANAFFGLIISLLQFFLYFVYNIKNTAMKWLPQKMHKPNNSGMFWKIAVMKFAVMKFA